MPAHPLHAPVLGWYARSRRDLPWRGADVPPWSVLVSEVMLAQTPVDRVVPVHREWLARWPSPAALASAAPGDAVRAWGRLGYPRRALWLHETAVRLVAEHDGVVPDDEDALRVAARRRRVHRRGRPRLRVRPSRGGAGHQCAPGPCAGARRRRPPRLRPSGRPNGSGRPRCSPAGPPRGDVVGRGHGARRAGLPGHRPALRRVPARLAMCLAGGRPAAGRATAAPAALDRHRPAVPRPPPRCPPGVRRARPRFAARRRLARCGPTPPRAGLPGRGRAGRAAPRRPLALPTGSVERAG